MTSLPESPDTGPDTDSAAPLWPSARTRAQLREEKRQAVLLAAVRLFNAKGFHSTSLDDVAEALQVTKPTIYHYFKSKDDVLFECCQVGLRDMTAAFGAAMAQGGNGAVRLRALMVSYGLLMTRDFGMCITRTADSELSPSSLVRFRALKRDVDQFLRRAIREAMADGSIATADVHLTAFTISGAINWIGRWYAPEGPLSAQEIAEGIADRLMTGLAPR